MILFEGLLHQGDYKLDTLLEVLDVSFIALKEISDDFLHCFCVAFAVDCDYVDDLGHVEDPVIVDHLLVETRRELIVLTLMRNCESVID